MRNYPKDYRKFCATALAASWAWQLVLSAARNSSGRRQTANAPKAPLLTADHAALRV